MIRQFAGEETIEQLNEAFTNTVAKSSENFKLITDFFSILDLENKSTDFYPEYTIEDRKIQTVNDTQGLISAIESLKKEKIIGFDSEQKPTFKKNEPFHGVATIQLATFQECYVIQIKQTKDITPLIELLEDESIVKVGINLDGDREALYKEFKIKLRAGLSLIHI